MTLKHRLGNVQGGTGQGSLPPSSLISLPWLKEALYFPSVLPKNQQEENVEHKVEIIFYLHEEVLPREPINI